MGKHKYIETPEKMWDLFCEYREDIRNNPFQLVEQKKGSVIIPKKFEGSEEVLKEVIKAVVQLPLRRPLTFEGFENYCADQEVINDLGDYFSNKNNKYTEFSTICKRIKNVIRQDQIEGGMAGLYNASITQRLNGLTEKTENKMDVSDEMKALLKPFKSKK